MNAYEIRPDSEVFVAAIQRGNVQAILPLMEEHLRMTGSEIARAAAVAVMNLQQQFPVSKSSHPIIPGSRVQLILAWKDTGEYLRADVSLGAQATGRWQMVEVPEAMRTEGAFKGVREVPSVELELKDSPIILSAG
jgi:hypothetical protein